MDRGKTIKLLFGKINNTVLNCKNSNSKEINLMGKLLDEAGSSLESSAFWLQEEMKKNLDNAAAGATPFEYVWLDIRRLDNV